MAIHDRRLSSREFSASLRPYRARYANAMQLADLDNPFWSSLRTRHAAIAVRAGDALRYPPEYAPFLGIAHEDVSSDDLKLLIAPGESVYLIGVVPKAAPGFRLQAYGPLAQMVREKPLDVEDGPDMPPLGDSDREDVLALTALVYPHYFRARTMDMGMYFGIRCEGRLAAIIGERLGTHEATEMSAICTHPDFLGLGYARRLTAMLTNRTLEAGRLPFLHVSYENARAKALYERMGYRLRADVGFWSLRRDDS